ncbi:hypothetical protein QP028_09685 [Corynebacterium suedekumii]|nr:hypothetical protein QP028_09685 [Corynebacterium suedekumii]
MQAPRMRVGVFGDDDSDPLPDLLRSVGHEVIHMTDENAPDATEPDMLVIAAHEETSRSHVETVAGGVRRGQIILHTSLAHGVQILDDAETAGGVVIAAGQLSPTRWAVTTADELGHTIAELLFGELGASIITVTDQQRLQLAAAITYANALAFLRRDAVKLLDGVLDNVEESHDIVDRASLFTRFPDVAGSGGLQAQWRSIQDPGQARAFRQTVRRAAELTTVDDVELWAIQEDKP